ncbi:hypothetical protein GCM10009664_57320 [Kitasatospora gansuensis]
MPFVLPVSALSWAAVGPDRPEGRRDRLWFDLRVDANWAEEQLSSRIHQVGEAGARRPAHRSAPAGQRAAGLGQSGSDRGRDQGCGLLPEEESAATDRPKPRTGRPIRRPAAVRQASRHDRPPPHPVKLQPPPAF